MAFAKVIAFAVFKILHNLVSMQKAFSQITAEISKNYEKCPMKPNLFLLNLQKQLTVLCK